jgi:hypothetical protein
VLQEVRVASGAPAVELELPSREAERVDGEHGGE